MKPHLWGFLILYLWLLPLCGLAQRQDTVVYFFNSALQRVRSREEADYGGVLVGNARSGWRLVVFFHNGYPMLEGSYESRNLRIRNGFFTTFYQNGKPATQSRYDHNRLNGTWRSWYSGTGIRDSGAYREGKRTGTWKTWYANRKLESSGTYARGLKEGLWFWYRTDGKPSTREKYLHDTLEELSCFNRLGRSAGCLCGVDIPASFPGGADSLNRFIVENLLYPGEAVREGIQGDVAVSFSIRPDGSMGPIRITSSPSPVLSNEVIRLLRSMPRWDPAVSHNRRVDYPEKLVLPFFFNE